MKAVWLSLGLICGAAPALAQSQEVPSPSELEAARDHAVHIQTLMGDWPDEGFELVGFPDGQTAHIRRDSGDWLCDLVDEGSIRVMRNCGLVVSEARGNEGLIGAELMLIRQRVGVDGMQVQIAAFMQSLDCRIAMERDGTIMDHEVMKFGHYIGIRHDLLRARESERLESYLNSRIEFLYRDAERTTDGIHVTIEGC